MNRGQMTAEERRKRKAEFQRVYYRKHLEKCKAYEQTESRMEKNKERQRLYRLKYPEKTTALVKAWAQRHPEKMAAYQKKSYLKYHEQNKAKGRAYGKKYYPENYHRLKYGISREQFDQMIVAQGGLCQICEVELTRPHVDHDHFTGKIRGILCRYCNQALGFFRDSPQILRKAADYLENRQ
jgi:Recombination endonuclease VII